MSDKSNNNPTDKPNIDADKLTTQEAIKRGKKGRLKTSNKSHSNRKTASPNYSDKTIRRVRKAVKDNRAIVRIAIASSAVLTLGTIFKHQVIDSTLAITEKLKNVAEAAYYKSFQAKLEDERNEYEKMSYSDKVDTITELEKLDNYGYDVCGEFHISDKDFDDIKRINLLYLSGLNGEPLYTGDRPIEDVVRSVFDNKLQFIGIPSNETTPPNKEVEYGIGDDNKTYLKINGKTMKLDKDMEEIIRFVSDFEGLDEEEMTDAQKATYFFDVMNDFNKLVTTVPGFTYKDGNIVGVRAGTANFSTLVKRTPEKAEIKESSFDTISYLNEISKDIDIEKAFYTEKSTLEEINQYNNLLKKVENGEKIEYCPKDFALFISRFLRQKISKSINDGKGKNVIPTTICPGDRNHLNAKLMAGDIEVSLDSKTQDLVNLINNLEDGYLDYEGNSRDPEQFKRLFEYMCKATDFFPRTSFSEDGKPNSISYRRISDLIRSPQQEVDSDDGYGEYE